MRPGFGVSWVECFHVAVRGVHTPLRCTVIPMGRTNIDIDDDLVHVVMDRYGLTTKREAVDYALRALAGQPMTSAEIDEMYGSMPDFPVIPDSGP